MAGGTLLTITMSAIHTHTHKETFKQWLLDSLFLSLCRTLNKKDLFLFAFVLLNCIDPYWEQVSLQLLQ